MRSRHLRSHGNTMSFGCRVKWLRVRRAGASIALAEACHINVKLSHISPASAIFRAVSSACAARRPRSRCNNPASRQAFPVTRPIGLHERLCSRRFRFDACQCSAGAGDGCGGGGEERASGDADGNGSNRARALARRAAAQPVASALAGPRPFRAVERPRLDAAVRAAAPHRLRSADRGAEAIPPAPLEDARAPGARPHRRGRDHHRAARAGPRQRGRHGAGRAPARRALQPSGARDRRSPDVRLHG